MPFILRSKQMCNHPPLFFFFNDTATTEIYTLSLHDALPIYEPVKLSDYKGKWVVLLFYPLDFTFVCPTELTTFSERYEDFEGIGAEVIGVSTDSAFSHRAWLQTPRDKGGVEGLKYPLAADVTKSVSRDYGVLVEDKGIALRGLFV